MICPDCCRAADEARPELHCSDPGCTCQHRTSQSNPPAACAADTVETAEVTQ